MLPSINDLLQLKIVNEEKSSNNYKMNLEKLTIKGEVKDLEAMVQVIFKILSTERYRYFIYSWNYGIELNDLFGKPINYVCAEAERRITEALIQDDRIISIDNFNFTTVEKNKIVASFTVHTIFGDLYSEKEVII